MQVKFYFYAKLIQKQSNEIIKKECKKIISFSKSVLNKAIKKGGSSIRDFKNISGKNGIFKKNLKFIKEKI